MIRLTSIEKIDLEEEIKDDTPISADNPTPAQSANDNECVDRPQRPVNLTFADSVTVSSSPRNVREDALARSGYVFVHPPLLVLINR
jgi:hypothetical protein